MKTLLEAIAHAEFLGYEVTFKRRGGYRVIVLFYESIVEDYEIQQIVNREKEDLESRNLQTLVWMIDEMFKNSNLPKNLRKWIKPQK